MGLSKLQEIIINAPENKIAVEASAAAGKTVVLTEKVRKLLREGINPNKIAVITFTNLAAQELKDRLAADYKDGIFIGTIHSLAAYCLAVNGYAEQANKVKDDQKFDRLFTLCKKINIIKRYDWVLVDECQDCGEAQLEFIFKMLQTDHFFVCFDYKQSIYGFNGARPDLLREYLEDMDATVYHLNENYRNGSSILTFAKNIIIHTFEKDDSVPMRNIRGTVYECDPSLDTVKKWISQNGSFGDWAVLCNTNEEIANICYYLTKNGIDNVTFKQGDLNKEQLEDLMKSNTVKVLTRHSAKGLEFPNVIVWNPQRWNGDEGYRVNYVAATRARDILVWMEAKKKKRSSYKKKEAEWF